MNVEFKEFDLNEIKKMNPSQYDCVFITKNGVYVEGSIDFVEGDVEVMLFNSFEGEHIPADENKIGYYMVKES